MTRVEMAFLTLFSIAGGLLIYQRPFDAIYIGTVLGFLFLYAFDLRRITVFNYSYKVLWLCVFGTVTYAFFQESPEEFWRGFAGAAIFIGVMYEQNYRLKSERHSSHSTLIPLMGFVVLSMSQNLAILSAEVSFAVAVVSLVIMSTVDLGCLGQYKLIRRGDLHPLAVRSLVGGLAITKYTAEYLPSGISAETLEQLRVLIPALGLMLAIFTLFYKRAIDRFLVFASTWSLFILWMGLCQTSVIVLISAAVFGSLSLISFSEDPKESKEFAGPFLTWSAWGAPGSLCSAILAINMNAYTSLQDRLGMAVWILSLVTLWIAALASLEFKKINFSLDGASWRQVFLAAMQALGPAALVIGIETVRSGVGS
ncbi:MAG: hypothetical protein IT289_12935 [Oligoflexia bacterium]|nr:hypothetical protein [Oligoflexia bacterium]